MSGDETEMAGDFEFEDLVTDEDLYEAAKSHIRSVATRLLGADADKLVFSITESGNIDIDGPDELVDRLSEEIERLEAAGEM